MATCVYSDLDEASCDHCRRGAKPAPRSASPTRTAGPIEARYRGFCRACGEPFTPGTLLTPSDTDGWIAECCAEEDA